MAGGRSCPTTLQVMLSAYGHAFERHRGMGPRETVVGRRDVKQTARDSPFPDAKLGVGYDRGSQLDRSSWRE